LKRTDLSGSLLEVRNEDFADNSNAHRISEEQFKSLMRSMAASVAIIATNQDGRYHGMTATAMCSVSATPATLLIVINRSTRSHPIISATKYFTVNILAEHQQAIGKRFASRHINPFDGIEHRVGFNGSLIISEAAAYIECTTVAEIDVGTHTIFVGNIIGGDVSRARPLLYHDGKYKSVSPRLPDGDITASFFNV